jgi:hypothetical protein
MYGVYYREGVWKRSWYSVNVPGIIMGGVLADELDRKVLPPWGPL